MITDILLLLLFLAPVVQYRIEAGGFSFTAVEPITLLVVVVLLSKQLIRHRRLVIVNDPLVFLMLGMVMWTALIRPWSEDWTHGLSDIRDWLFPVMGYITLTSTIRRGWRRWLALFLIIVVCQALLGVYQHFTDSARPFVSMSAAYKSGFAISPETNRLALVSFAVGLFTHPNGYAVYLFIGLMIALGWPVPKRHSWLTLLLIAPIALALFWSYAKASLLVMMFAIIWFVLQRKLRANQMLLIITGVVLLISAVGLLVIVQLIPPVFLDTLYWRVGLWQVAFQLIRDQPWILFFGNGMEAFARQAYYDQPHNVYIFLLLEYGILGWV